MGSKEDRLESMLFQCTHTEPMSKHVYKIQEDKGRNYITKPSEKKERKRPEIALHEASPAFVTNMTKWVDGLPRFDLFIQPNTVHRTDPRVTQRPYDKLGDPNREQAQKTRPRLVMTPGLSLDDIEDPKSRSLIIDYTYTTSLTAAQVPVAKAAFPDENNVKAPLGETYAPPNPIGIPKLKRNPEVSPEWQEGSREWDEKQLRVFTDTTKMFWLQAESRRSKARNSKTKP